MGVKKISDNIYSIGVINPSLRIFDIVMESKYGTSYNSYFIAGKKSVIIDTVHNEFFDEYINNIKSITDIAKIDYIVMNHTEPDHSGSLKRILNLNPKIKIVCTIQGQKYLRQITNSDFDCICVKDGDTLNIGGNELKFVVAPMLHWPDSMMTWFEEDKALFSCDFLGAHFCEPGIFDKDMHYKDEYLSEFKYYYQGIFSPFKPFVLSGIEKIKNFDISMVCPSHGPILAEFFKERIEDYYNWSIEEPSNDKYIVILYASCYGFTKKLAQASAEAINKIDGIKAEVIDAVSNPINKTIESISKSSGVMVGSCTINRDAPKVIWNILSSIDAVNLRGKPAGCFGSYGWSGEAVGMIENRLRDLGLKVKERGIKVNFMPCDDDLKAIKLYAVNIAISVK